MELWIVAALGAALFGGVTAILAKCGIEHTDSDVATAVRTAVVLAFAWIVAAIAVPDIPAALAAITPRSYAFLALSGLATGGSWIFYFKALSAGDLNKVVPIDKSSTALAALLAIVLFDETGHLGIKLVSIAVILAGTLLMIERRTGGGEGADASKGARAWLVYALLAALFAALTSVLAKMGIEGVDSNLATALRTVVVLALAWGIVAARGKMSQVRTLIPREGAFLAASGVATGASWLCYYYAIQNGQVSVAMQLDKLSILVSIGFAWLVFGERLSPRSAVGLALIVAGTLAMTAWT